jgi:PAS domain S-box-containing protein
MIIQNVFGDQDIMSRYTVLNIEDNEAARYAKTLSLQRAGYHVIEAKNGREALRLVKQVSPQLVVLNINLPDVDGFEICRRIKTDPSTGSIMVLQTSGPRVTSVDKIGSLEGGADGYLIEPAEPEELVAYVEALLRLYRREAENREQAVRLHALEELFRVTFEAARETILFCDRNGVIARASRMAEELAGHAVVGKRFEEAFPLEVDPGERFQLWAGTGERDCTVQSARADAEPYREVSFTRHDGKRVHALLSCGCVPAAAGAALLDRVITLTDITERKRTEQEAAEGKRILDAVMEFVPEGITIADAPDVTIRQISRYGLELTGKPRRVLEGASVGQHVEQWDIYCADGRTRPGNEDLPLTRATQRGELVRDEEWVLGNSAGQRIPILCSAGPIRDAAGKITGGIIAWRDITDRKRREEELAGALQRLSAHMDNSPLAIVEFDPQFRVIRWSKEAEHIFGWTAEEMVGRSIAEMRWIHEEDVQSVREISADLLSARRPSDLNVNRNYRKDGSVIDCEWYNSGIYDAQGRLISVLSQVLDITDRKRAEGQLRSFNAELEKRVERRTAALQEANATILKDFEERKRLQAQLQQAEKMKSIGMLAGGIAHDFNNILNVIKGYASLLQEHRCNGEDISDIVKIIDEAVDKGSSTVCELLTLASKTELELKSVDADAIINDMARLLTRTFPRDIEVSVKRGSDVPLATADQNHISQALLNLCVNARDAMPSGGRLTLATGVVHGHDLRERHLEAEDKIYVFIDVADTGKGMDDAVRSRIFEPFFTTKGPGKGTGLGLAMVYGIVKNHDGFIDVESEPQRGTKFRIYLPVAVGRAKTKQISYPDST